MLSNLASYIFGSSEVGTEAEGGSVLQPSPVAAPHSAPGSSGSSSEEEGWVLVGTPTHDLNLGSIHEIPGSLLSSEAEDEELSSSHGGEEGVASSSVEGSRRGGVAPPPLPSSNVVLAHSKAFVAAQHALQKKTKKALSAKMLERQNKAVKISGSCKKQSAKHNFSIKSSGLNKQLKQC